jgi:hypothetical protein
METQGEFTQKLFDPPTNGGFFNVNNAFIRKSTTYYTFDSVKGSPYTLSSDARTRMLK